MVTQVEHLEGTKKGPLDLLSAQYEQLTTISQRLEQIEARMVQPPATGLKVLNIVLADANTEYEWVIPQGTKRLVMHARGNNAVRISTEMGRVAGSKNPYWTIKANALISAHGLVIPDYLHKLYFACSAAAEVVEIILGATSEALDNIDPATQDFSNLPAADPLVVGEAWIAPDGKIVVSAGP